MSLPLLEAVPNVSAGRDRALVESIVQATVDGAKRGGLLDGSSARVADVHRDSDHDRSVITIIGRGEAFVGALEALARAAVESIDLAAASGVHPRVGALDVLPVVPLEAGDVARAAAFGAVERVARTIRHDLGVPVVRYGRGVDGEPVAGAAFAGAVRRGGVEAIMERSSRGELELVAGAGAPHPSAGVTIAGVRDILVAFNVDLDTGDVEQARAIAARIRAATGGPDSLPGVRALGLHLQSRGAAQVSTNVEQYATCGPARVLDTVARIASELGAGLSTAELVGLAPDAALVPLRYSCTRHGVPLLAAVDPSLEDAAAR